MVYCCPKCGSRDVLTMTVVLKWKKAKSKDPKDVQRTLGVMVTCNGCGEKTVVRYRPKWLKRVTA